MTFQDFLRAYQKKEVISFNNSSMEDPLVSVSVVTYQHVNYIKNCLDGILKQQTNFPFEILIGEDKSTDGTREICLEYAKKYPNKIRLFLHHRENNIKINGAPTGRFNFIYNLFSARGAYIALCDGDDYWTDPYKLQKQVEFLNENKASRICFTQNSFLTDQDEILERKTDQIPKCGNFTDLIGENYIVNSTVLFKNTIPEEGLPSFLMETYIGDWPLHLWLLRNDENLSFLNFNSTVYRRNEGISHRYKEQPILSINSRLLMKKNILNHHDFKKYTKQIKKSIKKDYLSLMSYNIKRWNLLASLFFMFKVINIKNIFHTLKIFGYSFKLAMRKKY